MRKEITIVTENYVSGGLDTFLIDLINGLSRKYNVVLFCNKTHPGLRNIKKNISGTIKIEEYCFFTNSLTYRGSLSDSRFNRRAIKSGLSIVRRIVAYPFMLYTFLYWINIFRNSSSDELVIANGGHPGGQICRLVSAAWYVSKSKKAIYNVHNLREKLPFYRVPIEFFLDVLLVKTVKNIITVSRATKESLDSSPAFRMLRAPTSVIYNGSRTPRDYQSSSNIGKHITVLATYEERKGHIDLLKAIKLLKDRGKRVNVKCYGHIHREYYSYLLSQIDKMNLKDLIELNDFDNNIDLIFSTTQALVIPSKSFESFGLVAVEAFLRNVPVVAYKSGGLIEVVNTEVGLLVENGDIDSLSIAIEKIVFDKTLRERLSSKTYEYAIQNFSVDRMVDDYLIAIGER